MASEVTASTCKEAFNSYWASNEDTILESILTKCSETASSGGSVRYILEPVSSNVVDMLRAKGFRVEAYIYEKEFTEGIKISWN